MFILYWMLVTGSEGTISSHPNGQTIAKTSLQASLDAADIAGCSMALAVFMCGSPPVCLKRYKTPSRTFLSSGYSAVPWMGPFTLSRTLRWCYNLWASIHLWQRENTIGYWQLNSLAQSTTIPWERSSSSGRTPGSLKKGQSCTATFSWWHPQNDHFDPLVKGLKLCPAPDFTLHISPFHPYEVSLSHFLLS